jgi:HK97 family phage major capsid protein
MRLYELREARTAKLAEMRTLHEAAAAANRDLDGNERARFDALEGELRTLSARLTDAEKLADFERQMGAADDGGMSRELRGYSLAKAVMEGMNGRLSGLEAEAHQELSRGREARGVMVPTEVLMETRVISTTGGTSGGGNLVATDLAPMTDRRRPMLAVEGMGATIMRGLTGNLDLPRMTASGTAAWVAEDAAATTTDPTFAKVSMAPKTVAAQYQLTRRMMLQSQTTLEPILRADLGFLLAQRLDAAAIRGGGTNEPVGIIANTNVAAVTGGVLTLELTADMIGALEVDDVTGTTGFLTHPLVMTVARKTKSADGQPLGLATIFHGKPVMASTQVPTNLGAGTNRRGLIYGEWASLYVGYWSGVDILVNPYADAVASKGGALLHAFLDCDVVVRHPEGFRKMEIN